MKIGIDARFYGPRTGGGGIGRYVAELVNHLQLLDPKNDYSLFLKKDNFHECKITAPRFHKRMTDVHWYTLREQTVMRREVHLSKVDFMHYPHWNIPLFSKTPFIVTIHDLILLEDKHSARSSTRHPIIHGFKYAGFRTILEAAVHRSKHIITVSKYSKERLLEHFGIKEDKISVIYNGILPPKTPKGVDLARLGVYDPYFLYVGNAYPHKNLEMMLHAFSEYSRHRNGYVQLVIAGKRDTFSYALEKEAREVGIRPELLRFINLPTDEELAALYKNASLFLFPSRIEGFGIPPLEAMSHGTPVAASRSASLPEILKDAATYFHHEDIETLIEIMDIAVTHPEIFDTKRVQGKKIAKQYTWLKTAEETLSVYEKTFGQSN